MSVPFPRSRCETKKTSKHVFRGLLAYHCTNDDCSTSDRMFETRNDWYRHELDCHRKEWYCDMCGHPVFQRKGQFLDHMHQNHVTQLSRNQLSSVDGLSERQASGKASCSFCTTNQNDISDGFDRNRTSSKLREVGMQEVQKTLTSRESSPCWYRASLTSQ